MHFVVFPTADSMRGYECALKWMRGGYEVLLGLDEGKRIDDPHVYTVELRSPFAGYYKVINELVANALDGGDLVTCIGDDMDPPTQGALHVAEMYFSRFPDGFGVLQGTGDMQGKDAYGVQAAARICGSPTFGRGWFERAYGGRGPFHDGYRSFYADEDLWNVAKKCGVLWLEPSLTIKHLHWSWGHMKQQPYHARAQENWTTDRALFFARQAEGFPGWEPKT